MTEHTEYPLGEPEPESAWDKGIRTHSWALRVGRECEDGSVQVVCLDPCEGDPKRDGRDCACHHLPVDGGYDVAQFDIPVTFTHEGAYSAGWCGSEWDEGEWGYLEMKVKHDD